LGVLIKFSLVIFLLFGKSPGDSGCYLPTFHPGIVRLLFSCMRQLLNSNRFKTTLVFFAWHLASAVAVAEQAPSAIVLAGVSFECEDCIRLDDQGCARGLGPRKKPIKCSSLLADLLEEAIESDNKPGDHELFELMFSGQEPLWIRLLAQEVLLSSGSGRDYFLTYFSTVAAGNESQARILLGAISEGGLFLRLWSRERLVVKGGMSREFRLRIACGAEVTSLGRVFDRVKPIVAPGDFSALVPELSGLSQSCPVLYKELVETIDFFRECQTNPNLCDPGTLDNFSRRTVSYLARVLEEKVVSVAPIVENNEIVAPVSSDSKEASLSKRALPLPDFSFQFSDFTTVLFLLSLVPFTLGMRKYLKRRGSEGRRELTLLLHSMGLAEDVSKEGLAKRFKHLAKEVHPDVADTGSEIEFADLNWRYNRARELMAAKPARLSLN